MANCVTKLTAGLDASCEALNKIGGLDKTIYFGNLSEATFTTDADGYVDSITLASSPAAYLYKYVGKTKKHNSTNELQVGENTNTIKQSVLAKLYYYFPNERAAIEALYKAQDLFAIIQTESGLFELFGMDKGIRAAALTNANGILINDDTSVTITISGEEKDFPKVVKLGAAIPGEDTDYLTQNLDALDALAA